MKLYPLTLLKDDNDTWLVTSPDFPEVTTYGATKPEASYWGSKAIKEAIASRLRNNEAIPLPSDTGDIFVPI